VAGKKPGEMAITPKVTLQQGMVVMNRAEGRGQGFGVGSRMRHLSLLLKLVSPAFVRSWQS